MDGLKKGALVLALAIALSPAAVAGAAPPDVFGTESAQAEKAGSAKAPAATVKPVPAEEKTLEKTPEAGEPAETNAAESGTAETAGSVEKMPPLQRPLTDPMVEHPDLIGKFYLTSGSKLEKVTSLIEGLPSADSGLDKAHPYYLRVEKKLTDKLMRRVTAYDGATKEQIADFYVTKDDASVWRMDDGRGLIYGTPDKVLDKSYLSLPTGSYLIIGEEEEMKLVTPGGVPYTLRVTSLNENVVRVEGASTLLAQKEGKADIIADVEVGGKHESVTGKLRAVTKKELELIIYRRQVSAAYMWRDLWGSPFGFGYWGYRPPLPPPPPRPRR